MLFDEIADEIPVFSESFGEPDYGAIANALVDEDLSFFDDECEMFEWGES